LVRTILAGNLGSFSVISPEFSRKLVQKITGDLMGWKPFDESKNEGASEL